VRIIKLALVVARFLGVAVILVWMFLDMTVGKGLVSQYLIGLASGTVALTTGFLLILGGISGENGSDTLLVSILFSIGCFALGVAFLSGGGVLPDEFRLWAGGVFLVWFALVAIIFITVQISAEREERKSNPGQPPPRQGMSPAQLALLMMGAGVITTLVALKFLLFGPAPYSVLAYFLGPCLIVGGFLVDPNPIRTLRNEGIEPPGPPGSTGG
jgi:hypothetical protein